MTLKNTQITKTGRPTLQKVQGKIIKNTVLGSKREGVTIQNAHICTSVGDAEPLHTGQKNAKSLTEIYHSPVKPSVLEKYLEGYNREIKDYLIKGFTEGFRLNFKGKNRNLREPKNLKSAFKHEEVLRAKIEEELQTGRYVGPFNEPPLKNLTISPLGVEPKKDKNKYRVITHLSYPEGSSINDGISKEDSSVKYASIGDAIKLIKKAGRNAYMCKTDLKDAYRLIPLHPSQFKLTGLKFKGQYIIDRALPQGCASSAKIFETFSTAIEWIAKVKLNIKMIIHILDDFFWVSVGEDNCLNDKNKFLEFCKEAGIPTVIKKTLGPDTVMEFAGIELDSIKMSARLPSGKIEKCLNKIEEILSKSKTTVNEIQRITGLLNFATSVVYPGRAFLRRMYNAIIGKKSKYSVVTISNNMREDLNMWRQFLREFNGINLFKQDWWVNDKSLNLYTDSSKTIGFGGVFGRKWFYGTWENEKIKRLDITTLELYPIVLAIGIWGEELKNLNINIHTDNEGLVSIINSQTVKKNDRCLHLLRQFVLLCLKHNILFRAWHIQGKHNTLSDSLSRLQIKKFKSLAPDVEELPTPVPKNLSPNTLLKT